MNERSCDNDDLFELLNKVWAEDGLIRDSISYDKRVRGPLLFHGSVTSPVDHRERLALE